MDLFADADIISQYTRRQAIEDGVLHDVTETAREAGFTVPVAITTAAWHDSVAWPAGNAAYQDEAGRLWDVVGQARNAARAKGPGERRSFPLLRVPNTPRATRPTLTRLEMHSGPGDSGEHVITIGLPGED